jgi:FixJ family two-component response regulator
MIGSKPLAVAVVDDDESVRDALSNLLASLDLGVATFASAEEFLASPASRAAACLITDVQMPGMSGLDLQRHLVASGNGIPVILITAFPRDHLRQQADAEGAFGFFAKPFDGRLMIDCIERALVGRKHPHD